jgi:hypothetical protein
MSQDTKQSAIEAAKQLRVYDVEVWGAGIGRYNATSSGAAKYAAYLSDAFCHLTFKEFLGISSARLHRDPVNDGYARLRQYYPDCCIPEPGARIKAEGLTGTVLPALRSTQYVVFQPDGQTREAFVHPASVTLATRAQGESS